MNQEQTERIHRYFKELAEEYKKFSQSYDALSQGLYGTKTSLKNLIQLASDMRMAALLASGDLMALIGVLEETPKENETANSQET